MTSATFAPSAFNTGAVVWDVELYNDDPANYSRGQAPSGGPPQGLINIAQPGTYNVTASVLVIQGQEGFEAPNLPPLEIDVDLYVHGSLGFPSGRVDSFRGTSGPNGWVSVRLGGVYQLPQGGQVIVQTDAGIHGDPDPRWTHLTVTKLG